MEGSYQRSGYENIEEKVNIPVQQSVSAQEVQNPHGIYNC